MPVMAKLPCAPSCGTSVRSIGWVLTANRWRPSRMRLPAVGEQVEPVAQGPPGLLLRRLDPARPAPRPVRRRPGRAARPATRSELGHHRVGGEVGVDLVERAQRGQPPGDAAEDAFGGGEQPVGPPGALVELRLLAGGERLVDVVALGRRAGRRSRRTRRSATPGSPAWSISRPSCSSHRLGRVGDGQRAGDGLAEQRELGRERGPALGRRAARAGGRPAAARARLTPPSTSAMPLQDGGAHGRVGDVERADHLGDDLQPLGLRRSAAR